MTRADLRKLTLALAGKYGVGDLTDSNYFTADQALTLAHDRFAIETECYESAEVTTASVIAQSVYLKSAFGTSSAGARIFKVSYAAYAGTEITELSKARLDAENRNWRALTGTPTGWLPWGDGKVRVYPIPVVAADLILVQGFETADPATFDGDTESPAFHIGWHHLLAVWAAILLTTSEPENDASLRESVMFPTWKDGIADFKAKTRGSRSPVEVGRYAGQLSRGRRVAETIT